MQLKAFSSVGPEQLEFLIRDSIENAFRVLALIKTDDPKDLAIFDALAEKSKTERINLLKLVAGAAPLPTVPATLMILNVLYRWMQSDIFSGYQWSLDIVRVNWESGELANNEETRIVRGMLDALAPMAGIQATGDGNAHWITQTAVAFADLAETLESQEHWRAALGCGQSALHFFQANKDWDSAEAAAVVCLRLAKRLEDADLIAGELQRTAALLCQRALENEDRHKDAFDALESALRYLTTDPRLGQEQGEMVRPFVKHEYFRLLQSLALSSRPQTEWPAAVPGVEPEQLKELLLSFHPVWNIDPVTFFKRLTTARTWANEIENQRLQWDPLPPADLAVASWIRFGFTHPHTRRSIPHSESILKEQKRDDLLLDIAHETTHVYSILGSVGFAAWAMRCGFIELETHLWSATIDPEDHLAPQRWAHTRKPAQLLPISKDDVGTAARNLCRVEQELEVERKIQLIERLWAPWFEGLALFGEHATDPRDDPDSFSPVAAVLRNIFDVSPDDYAKTHKISHQEALDYLIARTETLFGEAQEHEGVFRLGGYFDGPMHAKYLAGYLAVRAVVAAWRAKLDRPLNGADAFEMLLHATRYSGTELVPPSDLPLEEFQRQVLERQLQWLREISGVPKEDLELLIKGYAKVDEQSGYVWLKGRIQGARGAAAEVEQYSQKLVERMAQTRFTLAGERAHVSRAPGASPACQALMMVAAESLERAAPTTAMIKVTMLNSILGGVTVMPIGQVHAPFWLNEQHHHFVYWIRTREKDVEHGKPSYNATSDPLPESEFKELKKRVELGAPSRVTVTRVAYLADPNSQLLQGTNYLAFQLDDWFWIRNAGMYFAHSKVPEEVKQAVRSRLDPHPFQAMQEVLLDSETHPCTRRSAEWLASSDWQFSEGDSFELAPWAGRAAYLATQILNTTEADDALPVNRALYEFVLGDSAQASRLSAQGLDFLHKNTQLKLVAKLLQKLPETGRLAVKDDSFEILAGQLSEADFPIFERTSHGWDVIRPASLRTPTSSKL